MLREHEPQASISTASSFEFSQTFPRMFSISFREHRDGEKENSLSTLIIKK